MTRKEPQPLPIACTLTPGAMADRRLAWQALADRALTAKRDTPRGVELTYAPRETVEAELRELADLEADCCSWASWTVRATGGDVVLEVTAPQDAVGDLQSMFAPRSVRPQLEAAIRAAPEVQPGSA